MTEEPETSDSEQPAVEPAGVRAGERLKEARREQQISVLEVAKELHLDEAKVRALERNEFDKLGAPVFAKGHLRKYAELVGVDPDDVFEDYYHMTRSESMPPVVAVRRSKPRRELSPGPWVAVIVVIIATAVGYWWFVGQSQTVPAPTSAAPEADVPQQSVEVAPAPTQPEPDVAAVVQQAEDPAPADSEPAPVPTPVTDGETSLSLSFSGDCWTEISDAGGRRLLFDMGRAGRAVELSGTAPFAVLFGNAENVTVEVNGEAYPISPSNPGSRTARLTIVSP